MYPVVPKIGWKGKGRPNVGITEIMSKREKREGSFRRRRRRRRHRVTNAHEILMPATKLVEKRETRENDGWRSVGCRKTARRKNTSFASFFEFRGAHPLPICKWYLACTYITATYCKYIFDEGLMQAVRMQ
jgi:hypothetical protein